MVVLFLDFDGVLHPLPSHGDTFSRVDALHEVLSAFPRVKIVITSSWREVYPLEVLLGCIGPLASRVVGVTPVLPGQTRQAEIEAWLSGHPCEAWLAMDDQRQLFEADCAWLMEVDSASALDALTLARLSAWLTGALR